MTRSKFQQGPETGHYHDTFGVDERQLAVFTSSVSFTNDQIKGMRVPVELVAPTEVLDYSGSPSSLPVPFSVLIQSRPVAGYTNVPNPTKMLVVWGSDWSLGVGQLTDSGTEADAGGLFTNNQFFARISAMDVDPISALDGGLQDNGLYLVIANGTGDSTTTGDLTGGDPANTMVVTVVYTIVSFG